MANNNRNPIPSDIINKALVIVVAIAVSLGVPIAVTSLFRNPDTQTNSEVSEKVSEVSSKRSDVSEKEEISENAGYYMADISQLEDVDYFAKGTLEHIFDGTINKKGNATGYHYTMVLDSKGKIIEGTRSAEDENGVFTGKVEVDGVKKNGFSSFYPEAWTPQQVVDAINTAYEDAISDPDNPSGSLWIGHSGDIEIDMYLDNNKKITTAYPVYERG